jgi:PKD repeat protein
MNNQKKEMMRCGRGIAITTLEITRAMDDCAPTSATTTLKKYMERNYEIVLTYNATHKGANPTWVNVSSSDTVESFHVNFNTKNGFNQRTIRDSSYLEIVATNTHQYYFNASGSFDPDGTIVSYEWDFGDGCSDEGIFFEHIFLEHGTYMVTLTVIDDDGAIAKEMLMVEVCPT